MVQTLSVSDHKSQYNDLFWVETRRDTGAAGQRVIR